MIDCWLSSHGKCGWCGCPQADEGGERKLKRINRELKEMGPQADGGGEQVLIIRTSFILSGAHQATQVSDERWMVTDCVLTENAEDK